MDCPARTGRRTLSAGPLTLREYKGSALVGAFMIDSLLNLLFRCSHRRLTRPVAPITKAGQPHSQSYVVCLDCGKQFEYDLKEMRIGKAIDRSHDGGVVPPNLPKPREAKIKYALLAAVPAAVVLGAVLKSKKTIAKPADGKPEPDARQPDRHKE
jgi:hypothetical protein